MLPRPLKYLAALLVVWAGAMVGACEDLPPGVALDSLVISPSSLQMDTVANAQFNVLAYLTDGSTAAVPGAVWTATGGIIDNTGLYTSGTAAGTFSVRAAHPTQPYADSVSVTVIAGFSQAATKLAITAAPATATSGQAIAPAILVQLQSASNINIGQAGVSITASIASGTGVLSGTISSSTNAGGQASFSNLIITGTGAHTITFASTGLTSVTTNTITVGAAASCGSGPGATITSVSRVAGSTAGGTALTITGTGFQATDCVRFGATSAGVTFVNATTLNVVTPAGLPGAVNVNVQQGGNTATLTNGFEYLPAATATIVTSSFESGLAPFVTATGATVTNTRARTGSQSVMHSFSGSGGQNAANYDHSGDPALLPGGVYIHWYLYIPAATRTALSSGQIKLHLQRYNGGGGWMELGTGPEITGGTGTIRLIGDPVSGNPPAGGSYTYPADAWVEVMVWYRRDTAAHTGTARWWIGSGGSLQFMGTLTSAQMGFDSPTSGVRSSFSIYTQNAASHPFSVFTDDVTIANGWIEP